MGRDKEFYHGLFNNATRPYFKPYFRIINKLVTTLLTNNQDYARIEIGSWVECQPDKQTIREWNEAGETVMCLTTNLELLTLDEIVDAAMNNNRAAQRYLDKI